MRNQDLRFINTIFLKIISIILGVFVLFVFVKFILINLNIDFNGKYAIAITLDKEKSHRSVYILTYKYFFDGKEFFGHDQYVKGMIVPKGRYFVKVSTKFPKFCRITNIEVPDTIVEAPLNGWKDIPIKTKN
jgi:hypothetical protein